MAIEASDVPSARQAYQSFNPPLVGMAIERAAQVAALAKSHVLSTHP